MAAISVSAISVITMSMCPCSLGTRCFSDVSALSFFEGYFDDVKIDFVFIYTFNRKRKQPGVAETFHCHVDRCSIWPGRLKDGCKCSFTNEFSWIFTLVFPNSISPVLFKRTKQSNITWLQHVTCMFQ